MSETHSTQPITGLNVLLCVDNTASMLRGRFTVSSTLIPDPATLSESDTGRALLSGYTLHDAAVHTAESLIKVSIVHFLMIFYVWCLNVCLRLVTRASTEFNVSVFALDDGRWIAGKMGLHPFFISV